MTAPALKTAYKVGIVGVITFAFLILSSSVIKCPAPAIVRLFFTQQLYDFKDNAWDFDLSFDPAKKMVQFFKTNSDFSNRTVLQIFVEDGSKSDDGWKGRANRNGLEGSLHQSTLIIRKGRTNNPLCYNVTAKPKRPTVKSLTHCMTFGSDFWFGGAEMYEQKWPINMLNLDHRGGKSKSDIKFYPFISHNFGDYPDAPGSVLERYWLSTGGVAFFVERNVPLHVGHNQTHFCLKSEQLDYWKGSDISLKYTVCLGDDVRSIHKFMASTYWPNPVGVPDALMTKDPIWTTWALYKRNINQSTVIDFGRQIKKHGFTVSQIEIDDKFSTFYGDFDFDKRKFPNPKLMIQTLHKLGCRVTAWIHPFMNPDSVNFGLAKKYGYLVLKDRTTKEPLIMKWWDGKGGLLDFTNEAATKWYFERRKALDDFGMNSYKYDAGESNFLGLKFVTNRTIGDPNLYSTAYANAAYSHTNKALEVRIGYMTQHLPIFVRVMDMNSVWSGSRGLDVLVPTVLHFGLIGYPFVLPDMIGGNFYQGQYPSREMFIRWTQVTAFLPSMQFSIVPWAYDQQVVDICRKMVKLHVDYVTPLLYKWGKVSTQNGDPIIRPLWWISPTDSKTYNESTNFLIGDDVLVVPIVLKGQTKKDVYIPNGIWKDVLRNKIVRGPITLRDYNIPLKDIAYFERIKPKRISRNEP